MLHEARLVYARPVESGLRPRTPLMGSDLVEQVLRRWKLCAATALCGAALGYGWSTIAVPVYTATAQIFIDPRSIQALDAPGVQTQGDNNAQVSFVESQAHIVGSEAVLSRVVTSQALDRDPFFDGEAPAGLMGTVVRKLGLSEPEVKPEAERARTALITLSDRVTVRRPERTFLMEVSVKAETADKAAGLANAVVQAYFDEQNAAHAVMANTASSALTARLDALRERVRQAEARVQTFKADHGLVGTRAQLSSEQQLTDANTQLAQAQGRVVQAQARLGSVEQMSAAKLDGDTPEAVTSGAITLLRGQQAEAKRHLSKALEQFGPRHPMVRDAQAEVEGIQHAITAELTRLNQAARVEYQRATAAAAAQKAMVDRLSQQAQQTSGSLLQLSQLEREVEINKDLLDTFLTRSRQVGELAAMDTTDGRVISTALPPLTRSFPPRGAAVALLGALAGFAFGALLALRPWAARPDRGAAPQRTPPLDVNPGVRPTVAG